jgi:hypothetical protein
MNHFVPAFLLCSLCISYPSILRSPLHLIALLSSLTLTAIVSPCQCPTPIHISFALAWCSTWLIPKAYRTSYSAFTIIVSSSESTLCGDNIAVISTALSISGASHVGYFAHLGLKRTQLVRENSRVHPLLEIFDGFMQLPRGSLMNLATAHGINQMNIQAFCPTLIDGLSRHFGLGGCCSPVTTACPHLACDHYILNGT